MQEKNDHGFQSPHSQSPNLTLTLLICHLKLFTISILHLAIYYCYGESNDDDTAGTNEYGRSYPVVCDQSCGKVKLMNELINN